MIHTIVEGQMNDVRDSNLDHTFTKMKIGVVNVFRTESSHMPTQMQIIQ